MAKKWKIYKDFSGFNDFFNQRKIKDSEFIKLESLVTDDPMGEIRTMGDFKTAHGDIGATSATDTITGGHGLFYYSADHKKGAPGADTGEDWVAVCDVGNAEILLWDRTGDTWAATLNLYPSSATGGVKAVYDFVDEALRVADGNFGATNYPIWRGYVERKHFFNSSGTQLTPGGSADSYDAWYTNNVQLAKPTRGIATAGVGALCGAGSGTSLPSTTVASFPSETDSELDSGTYKVANATDGAEGTVISRTNATTLVTSDISPDSWDSGDVYHLAPAAGTGFNVDVHESSTGTWNAGDYEFASTFIYDGNQESLLYNMSGEFTVTANYKLTIIVTVTAPFDERITGGRIYTRLIDSDDEWILLIDISLRNGIRIDTSSAFTGWSLSYANSNQLVSLITVYDQSAYTYEILNGFSQVEPSIDIGQTGDGYATSVIASRRRWIANTKRTSKDSIQLRERDALYYSEKDRFDTFPTANKLPIIKGDAEEWIKLEELGGKLLAFKQRTLYIVDIAAPSPSRWRILGKYNFMGVESSGAVVKSEMGIVWANKRGLHVFDGNRIRNLINGKMKNSTWESDYSSNTVIGYYPNRRRLFVRKDPTAGEADMWVYNFNTESWAKGVSIMSASAKQTNFAVDWDGDCFFGLATDTNTTITSYKWTDSAQASTTSECILIDDDFGSPGIDKEIIKIIVTYKSSATQSNALEYYKNGGTSPTALGSLANVGSTWTILAIVPDSFTPFKCQSLQIGLDAPSSGTINISDIAIEYREIPSRRAGS